MFKLEDRVQATAMFQLVEKNERKRLGIFSGLISDLKKYGWVVQRKNNQLRYINHFEDKICLISRKMV